MKTTFIRTLAVAILATSLSAFAVTSDSSPCADKKAAASTQNTKEVKKEKKARQKHNDQKENTSDQFSGIWG